MKSLNLARAGVLAVALAVAWLGAGIGIARADQITLDISANLSAAFEGAECGGVVGASGCTLSGDIVINNTTGAVISADVTMAEESPVVGPFTTGAELFVSSYGSGYPNTLLLLEDSAGDDLVLGLSTPTAGSLVGYDGGTLLPQPSGFYTVYDASEGVWALTSGTATAAVPEPPLYLLLVLGFFGVWGVQAYRLKKRAD